MLYRSADHECRECEITTQYVRPDKWACDLLTTPEGEEWIPDTGIRPDCPLPVGVLQIKVKDLSHTIEFADEGE